MRRVLLLAALLAACEPDVVVEPAPAQVIVFIDTDAPVPSSSRPTTGIFEPAPLFDRVRVEVFEPGAAEPCAGCTNDFPLDADLLRAKRTSFGVAPRPGASGYRVRIQMFLTSLASADAPLDPGSAVEKTVALPVVSGNERAEITVRLLVDTLGTPSGTPADPATPDEPAAPAASYVGTWAPAQRVDCETTAEPDEVCIPGGAFWMGQRTRLWTLIPNHDVFQPRLVVLSPYFLDAEEMTVANFRADPATAETIYVPWTGSSAGESLVDYCTITREPGPFEQMPATCINFAVARTFCERRAKVLPSEAQYEYAASGLRGDRFVWGNDLPTCADATFSRIGYGMFSASVTMCKPPVPPGGPQAVRSGARDRLVLPTGTVYDLAGNAVEWMRDDWNLSDEGCWSRPGIYVNPVCRSAQPSRDGTRKALRGGSWVVSGGQLERTIRSSAPPVFVTPELGFRCSRSDR